MDLIFCHGCKTPKHPKDFFVCRSRKNGRQTRCKACQTRTHKDYCITHVEQVKTTGSVYYFSNRDVLLVKHAQYREEHRIELQGQGQKYYIRNKETILLRGRQIYDTAKERVRRSRWRKQNPEKEAALQRLRRARKSGAAVTEKVFLDVVFIRDRGMCSICHKHVVRKEATLDHIIPLSRGGNHSYQNIALAHMSCNSRKSNRIVKQQMRLF